MATQDTKQKVIIFESKRRQLFIIGVCMLFILADYLTKDYTDDSLFWVSIFFLGGLAIYLTIRLLNPANDFVAKDSMRGMYLLENGFTMLKEEIGLFHYFEEGFSLEMGDETIRVDWKEIDTLIAYKENRNITDEICLDLFQQDSKILAVSESIPGWFQFIKRLPPRFPTVSAKWYDAMAENSAIPMVTVLYDRKRRHHHLVTKICFPDHIYYAMFKDGDGI